MPRNGVFAGFSPHPPSKGRLRIALPKRSKNGVGLKMGVSFDGSPFRGAFLTEICTPVVFGSFSRQKIEFEDKKTACPTEQTDSRRFVSLCLKLTLLIKHDR
jgi:hypothetical protein